MNCHRQETGGAPYDSTNPATALKVGINHGTLSFLSHPHANQYLNSPHAEYTGTFKQVALARFGTGYGSEFQNLGEAANTGNGCTGCHDVHTSTVTGEKPFAVECTECHSNSAEAGSVPQIDLSKINHLGGSGTPLAEMGTNPSEACISCHMPGGLHLWRINANASYSTFPASALAGTVNANIAADGAYTNAVWVDLDAACGQCHGGGVAQKVVAAGGNMTAGSAALTLPSSTGFTVGQRILVKGAGSLYYDETGQSKLNNDLETYIKAIPNATTLTLAGPAVVTVASADVTQNPTKNSAPYYTKSYLAGIAKGMHASAGVTYPVTFSASASGLHVNVDATVDCGGQACGPFTYDWTWGDGTPNGSGDPSSHDYASAGTKTIKLIVKQNDLQVGTYSRNIALANPDLAPTVDGTCSWTANTWVMQVVDASTDDGPDADTLPPDGNSTLKISVDWGDGTAKSNGNRGATFNHTYTKTGTFTVTRKATDSKLQVSSLTCPVQATPAYFTISGTVKNKLGTVNIGSAAVTVKKGTTVVKTVYTASNGTFNVTALKPGTYNFTVVKGGYTFPAPGTAGNPNVTVGPNGSAGVAGVIQATAP